MKANRRAPGQLSAMKKPEQEIEVCLHIEGDTVEKDV
jgi:hypothetical protein